MSNDNLMTSRRDFMRNLGVATVAGATGATLLSRQTQFAQAQSSYGSMIVVQGGTESNPRSLREALSTHVGHLGPSPNYNFVLAGTAQKRSIIYLSGYFEVTDHNVIDIGEEMHFTGNATISFATTSSSAPVGDAVFRLRSSNIKISNLKFKADSGNKNLFRGFSSEDHTNIYIENCVFDGVTVNISNGHAISEGAKVVGCIVTGSEFGVKVDTVDNTLIEGCYISNCGSKGIDSVNSNQTTITNNIIYDTNGVRVLDCNYSIVSGNRVYNNKRGSANGIHCQGRVNGITISNNICYGNSGSGIFVRRTDIKNNQGNITSRIRPENITITRNICNNNSVHGLVLSLCDRANVTNNIVYGHNNNPNLAGIQIGWSTHIVLVGNQSYGNSNNKDIRGGSNIDDAHNLPN